MENGPAKKNLGKELSACDLHQAVGASQSTCADINHGSTSVNILSITIGVTDINIVLFSVIWKEHNIKSFVDSGIQLVASRCFPEL